MPSDNSLIYGQSRRGINLCSTNWALAMVSHLAMGEFRIALATSFQILLAKMATQIFHYYTMSN